MIFLAGTEAHHALRVLRVRRGDRVTVLDGAGGEFQCLVENFDRDKVQLRVIETKKSPAPVARITLLQAIPKGKLIETIIQKATELGASRIVPLLSERVTTRLDAKTAARKAEDWQRTAVEAIKQCGAAWLPRVEAPLTPQEFLARGEKFDLPLVASLHAGRRHPREYFAEYRARTGRNPETVCVWVGPEGDFTPQEVAWVEAAGARPISLGPLVLRSDTAASYCLSVLNYELLSE